MPDETQINIQLSWKRQLRQYEPIEVSVGISGVTLGTTPDEMSRLIDGQGKIAYDMLVPVLKERMADAIAEAKGGV